MFVIPNVKLWAVFKFSVKTLFVSYILSSTTLVLKYLGYTVITTIKTQNTLFIRITATTDVMSSIIDQVMNQ